MSEAKTLKTLGFKIKDPLKIKLKHLVFQPRFKDGVTMSIFTKSLLRFVDDEKLNVVRCAWLLKSSEVYCERKN